MKFLSMKVRPFVWSSAAFCLVTGFLGTAVACGGPAIASTPTLSSIEINAAFVIITTLIFRGLASLRQSKPVPNRPPRVEVKPEPTPQSEAVCAAVK